MPECTTAATHAATVMLCARPFAFVAHTAAGHRMKLNTKSKQGAVAATPTHQCTMAKTRGETTLKSGCTQSNWVPNAIMAFGGYL